MTSSIGLRTAVDAGGSIAVRALHNVDPAGNPLSGRQAKAAATSAAGALFGGTGADVDAEASAKLSAYVSGGPGSALAAGGSVQVVGLSNNMATADADGFSGGLLAVGASFADAITAGTNTAHVDAQNVAAGSLDVKADTREETTAHTQSGAGGIVAGSGSIATAKSSSATTAYLNSPDAATVGAIAIRAASRPKTQATAEGVNGGALAVGVSQALAEQKPTTTAYVWPGARAKAGSDLTVEARHETAAPTLAEAYASSGGLVSVNGARADATATPTVDGYVGAGAVLDADGTSTVRTVNTNAARAVGDGLTIGLLVGVGAIESHSTANGQTRAHLDAAAKVTGGHLLVETTTSDAAVTETEASGGGLISIQGAVDGADSTAASLPVVRTFLADNSVVDVTGSVTVRAVTTTDADAVSQGVSVGAVAVSDSDAQVDVAPDVQSYIGSRAIVSADQDVVIETRYGQTVTLSDGSFDPAAVNNGTDTIVFSQPHGLITGTAVVYEPGAGNNPIGGLTAGRSYSVIRVDDQSVRLGAAFGPTGVAADQDTITFVGLHGLETGDKVVYDAGGGTAIGGLTSGQTYYVRRIDTNTIKLAATPAQAIAPLQPFASSAVNSATDTITLAGHGFANGQAVTYRAPMAKGFTSGQVERQGKPTDSIVINGHGLSTGQRVTYQTDGTPITGLTSGQDYYVIRLDADTIRLATTAQNASANPPVPVALEPKAIAASVQHSLRLPGEVPIPGLADGRTYYVTNVAGSSFQLSATAGGSAINLDATGVTGSHAIGVEGLDLNPAGASAQHTLRFDLNAIVATGTAHRLVGAGGALGFANPSSDGVPTASSAGSAGGFVGVKGTEATTKVRPVVSAYVNDDAAITAGSNVTILSRDVTNAAALARNNTAGFVAIGAGDSTAEIDAQNTAFVGKRAKIQAAGNLSLIAEASHQPTVFADASKGYGVITSVEATARADIVYVNLAQVGQNAQLTAGGQLLVDAFTAIEAQARGVAGGAALGFDGDASGRVQVGRQNLDDFAATVPLESQAVTHTEIQAGAQLLGRTVTLDATHREAQGRRHGPCRRRRVHLQHRCPRDCGRIQHRSGHHPHYGPGRGNEALGGPRPPRGSGHQCQRGR